MKLLPKKSGAVDADHATIARRGGNSMRPSKKKVRQSARGYRQRLLARIDELDRRALGAVVVFLDVVAEADRERTMRLLEAVSVLVAQVRDAGEVRP
jgi:hypothetical protein